MSEQDSTAQADALSPFRQQKVVLLTTFRRDGTPVGTPVHLAVDGDHGYFRSYHKAWKTKRLRNNPHVTVAPSSFGGKATGPALDGEAVLLDGPEIGRARKMIRRRAWFMQGVLVPLSHRAMRYRTMYYRLAPTPSPDDPA
jgi:uncharacterized protein